MEYRTMDNIGAKTSLLGFGCMRFPTNADGSINEELALDMLDRAYHAGVNYFDTAYPYHGGKSEPVRLWIVTPEIPIIWLRSFLSGK